MIKADIKRDRKGQFAEKPVADQVPTGDDLALLDVVATGSDDDSASRSVTCDNCGHSVRWGQSVKADHRTVCEECWTLSNRNEEQLDRGGVVHVHECDHCGGPADDPPLCKICLDAVGDMSETTNQNQFPISEPFPISRDGMARRQKLIDAEHAAYLEERGVIWDRRLKETYMTDRR